MNGYSAKSDSNQREIVAALRAVGALVLSLHRVGGGCPDLLVYFAGRLFLFEVKNGKHWKLTTAQKTFHGIWPVHVVTTKGQALRVIGLSAEGIE